MGVFKRIVKKLIYYILPASYVFMFHHITNQPDIQKSGCLLSFEKFKSMLLRYEGHYAPLDDVVSKNKRNCISITFDDGLADLYTLAYPFLKDHGIPFTAFILSDMLDKPGYITTEQLKIMSADPLVTIGSHGVTHEVFPKLNAENKRKELYQSKQILQELTGRNINCFAYSHGQYDEETLQLVKCYDYAMGVDGVPLNLITAKRYLLPRYNIEESTFDKMQNIFDKNFK